MFYDVDSVGDVGHASNVLVYSTIMYVYSAIGYTPLNYALYLLTYSLLRMYLYKCKQKKLSMCVPCFDLCSKYLLPICIHYAVLTWNTSGYSRQSRYNYYTLYIVYTSRFSVFYLVMESEIYHIKAHTAKKRWFEKQAMTVSVWLGLHNSEKILPSPV